MVIPIIIMALGFGVIPRSIIIFIFVLPMIVVNARTGVRTVPTDIIEIVPAYRDYVYFVLVDGRIVIVNPDTYVVVVIIA